jgi:hypothetical protein
MTVRVIPPETRERLTKLCGMFGSDHDGERAAAALKADQLVRQNGLTWHDIIMLPPRYESPRHEDLDDVQKMAMFCRAHQEKFNAKEREFIRAMLSWRGEPSEKQLKWLVDLFVRVGGAQ